MKATGAAAAGAAAASWGLRSSRAAGATNVLFVSIDDLGDWPTPFGGYPGPIHTPNLERLAARGVTFRNAHCTVPICNPSRAAVFSGVHNLYSGLYDFSAAVNNPTIASTPSLPEVFRAAGYRTMGGGKLFHAHYAYAAQETPWDGTSRIPVAWNAEGRVEANRTTGALLPGTYASALEWDEYHALSSQPVWLPAGKVNRMVALRGAFDWGIDDSEAAVQPDVSLVDWASARLAQPSSQPFFLGVGLYLPHLPWYLPSRYLARYPLESVHIPFVPPDEMADIPLPGQQTAFPSADSDHYEILRHGLGSWQSAVQHYLAAITFADEQIGRLLDALDAGPHADDTIVVLWSDHGWQLGEKFHWRKFTLWEPATRVPLIISGPGLATGAVSYEPVSLLDLYPTLAAMCLGQLPAHLMPGQRSVAGVSLAPTLANPAVPSAPGRAVVSALAPSSVSARDHRYRYIRHHDGSEELYDLGRDGGEHFNLLAGALSPETSYAHLLGPLRAAVTP